jgi:hypothetical protein
MLRAQSKEVQQMRGSALLAVAILAASCGNAVENVAQNAAEQAIERGLEAEGGGTVDVNIDDDQGTISIESDDGDSTISFGGGELPESLTVPVPDGYQVLSSSETSGDQPFVNASLEYPASAADDVVAFFDDYFESDDASVRQEASGDGMRIWTWASGDYSVSVSVTLADGEDSTLVGITQTG